MEIITNNGEIQGQEELLGRISRLESMVTTLTEVLANKVDKENIIDAINISEEGILISAEKIKINCKTTIDDGSISGAKIISLDGSKVTADSLSVISNRLGNVNKEIDASKASKEILDVPIQSWESKN